MNLAQLFHPAVERWFIGHFVQPTPAQAQAWPAIKAGRHSLIAAPTGSGKTLAAFLAAIDDLVRQGVEGPLADATQVVYVSPLMALHAIWRRRFNNSEPQSILSGITAIVEGSPAKSGKNIVVAC